MISNPYRSVALAKAAAGWLTALTLCGLQGCFSPMALDRAVIEYDKTTTDILSKQLLLNIARSHQHQPLHFTGVSNIAENPVNAMGLLVSEDEPAATDISVRFGDWYYALKPETGYQWNREGFRLLCQIFQMTMTDLAQKGAPAITIVK
jgi:hypothetical protein